MAKAEIDVDMHENSLDNSADSEYLGMVDERSFGSAEERSTLVPHSYLDPNENSSYQFKDISGSVTYKLIPMTGEETSNNQSHSPGHVLPDAEYFVISNPVEMFGGSASQKKVPRRDVQTKIVTAKKRDDKRRATHNEVERRRRDKINRWISTLATLLPNSGVPDSAASKGGILAKACDHITELTEKQKRLEKLEVENEKLVLEILRLNQELSEVRKDNATMRSQLGDSTVISHRIKGQKS